MADREPDLTKPVKIAESPVALTEWKKFVKEKGFTFTNVYDPTNRAIYGKYFVDITPELYVMDKDRILVGKNLHANQLEQVFERELKKN